jgi:hypothetical protein
MSDRPKTGKRTQIYLAARHAEWWDKIPRYDRSRIVAEALDLYRSQKEGQKGSTGAASGAEKDTGA